jgi:signal transduction histidine kinase
VQNPTGPAPRPDGTSWSQAPAPGEQPDAAAPPQRGGHDHWRAWQHQSGPWGLGHRARWARGPRHEGPLRRDPDDGLLGGVAAGLAARMGFEVTVVRLVIVVASLITVGFAAMVYSAMWLLVPATGADSTIWHKARADKRGITLAVGLGSVLFVLILVLRNLGVGFLGNVEWPLILCAAGLVLILRNAPLEEQATLRDVAAPLLGLTEGGTRRRVWLRVAAAILLLAVGSGFLAYGHESLAMLRPVAGAVLVLVGAALLLGPWWLGIARDLAEERRARIRAEERAEMAARVHDSVLQTLAMIQRRADQPQQVIQMARAQERELRAWLFDGRAPGSLDGEDITLASGIRQIQQEVEAQHGVPVEAVTVGDCDLDDDLRTLLAAAREATVNAAKWSGADVVSLFAEVEPGEVSLFVRDRGRGFDPDAVPEDRKGLAESVHGRMTRHGGSASVRSTPGQGTEVSLTMPRAAGERQPSRA